MERNSGGYSSANLEGLVRHSELIALPRARRESAVMESLLITLNEAKKMLGSS